MAFLPPQEVQPTPTVELPVVSAIVADDVPAPVTVLPPTQLDWTPPFSLDTAPFAPGSAQAWKMGAESITGAIMWLAGVVREERAARLLAEAKTAEVAFLAQQALDASNGGSKPAASAANGDRQDLRWKSWEAKAKVSEELSASRFDALSRDVASRALSQDLDALRDDLATQAAQIRQQVGKETRAALQEGVAREANNLRDQFERINAALNARLDLVDQRLEEVSLANPEEIKKAKELSTARPPSSAEPSKQAALKEDTIQASPKASSAAQQEVQDAPSRQSGPANPETAPEQQQVEIQKQKPEVMQALDGAGSHQELVAILKALESRVKDLESKKPGATAASSKPAKSAKDDVGPAQQVSASAAQPAAAATPIIEQPDESLSPRTEAHFAHLRQELLETLDIRLSELQTTLAQGLPASAVPTTVGQEPKAIAASDKAPAAEPVAAPIGLPAVTAAMPTDLPAAAAQPVVSQSSVPQAVKEAVSQAPAAAATASPAPASTPAPAATPAAKPPLQQDTADSIAMQAVEALRTELRTWVKGELQVLQMSVASKPKEEPSMPPIPAMPFGGGADDDAMDEFRKWIEETIQRVRSDLRQEMQQSLEQVQKTQGEPYTVSASPVPAAAASAMQDVQPGALDSQNARDLPLQPQLQHGLDDLPRLAVRITEIERAQLSPEKFARLDGRVSMLERATTGKEIAALQERFASIESADKAQKNADSNAMLEVQDELRRLKCRFEYLERIVPPDVQRAMVFFEPLKDDDEQGGSPLNSPNVLGPEDAIDGSFGVNAAGANGNVLRRLNRLQVQQDQTIDAARSLAEDGRREVSNLSLALKGVQRDGEIGQARIEALRSDINQLQARLEAVLPQMVSALEGAIGQEAMAKNLKGKPAEELQALQTLLMESPVDSAMRFVSQDTLRKAMEAVQADMQAWLDKLRQDILSAMVGKADNVELRSLAEQLDKQAELSPGRRMLVPISPGSAADEAAVVRWPVQQARCVSCDKKVNLPLAASGNDPWPSRGAMPLPPSFPPGRSPNSVSLRPLRREASTPTMPTDRNLIL